MAVLSCTQQLHYSPANFLTATCAGTPNPIGMGLDCTASNDICAGTPAPLCTADYTAVVPAICTLPCHTDADCGSGGSCQKDSQSGLSLCLPDACLPSSVTKASSGGNINTCPPTGANDAGVGATCTKGGNQCADTAAPFCTVDYAVVPAAFCTKTCTADSDCGTGASCAGTSTSTLRACVPNACLASEDGNTTVENSNTAGQCPPASANNDGVGKACTRNGGQCADTSAAYCSVDYFNTPYAFCTKMCSTTADCGDGASCQTDPNGSGLKACVPDTCLAAVGGGDPNNPNGTLTAETCGGNSRGVGKTCSENGHQCSGLAADLCTADVDPSLPGVCTRFCTSDASCGAQASCVSSSSFAGLSLCAPMGCIDPAP